jgi:pimeloyl-ACP methyl ester carboxylesterase
MPLGSRRTSSARQSRWALPCLVVLTTAALAGTPAAAQAADPCSSQAHYDWMGASVSATVSIPSLVQPNGITSYDGTILAPADAAAFPGRRPVVVIQHGLGGNQCAQWWTAQDLAGHGFIAVVWTSPQGADTVSAFVNAVDAMRSAIAFVRTPSNPYAAQSDTDRIAVAGHSLGSVVASYVQQDPDPGVRAAVAFDNLRRWVNGDSGGAVFECAAAEAGAITPRVPAIGFAKDQPCDAKPDFAPADLKLPGFENWRQAGVPAIELVMAGYNHLDFATPGSEDKHRDLAYFVEAWLDRWLLDDVAADDRLLADTLLDRPTASLLSTRFLSAAYLPGVVDSGDYVTYLNDTKAPATKRNGGPEGEIGRDRARRGVKFRFSANDPSATFECRLDDGDWKRCESPQAIGAPKVRPGRHTFRVRASDPRGNVESTPAVWRLRVEPE